MKKIKFLAKKALVIFFSNNRKYKVRTGIAKGFYRIGGYDYVKWFYRESKEIKFLKTLQLEGKMAFDIGANAGMFSLFLSSAVKSNGKVFSFEPNPGCFKELSVNIELNNVKNVKIFNLAIGKENYTDKLHFNPIWTGTGTLNKNIQNGMKSSEMVEVNVVSIDYLISTNKVPVPDFVKIDVEGLEYDVLRGFRVVLEKFKPTLFVEIHGATNNYKEKNILNIVRLLNEFNYRIIHVESGKNININNTDQAKIGHIYCY